jgi:hypothetical protein
LSRSFTSSPSSMSLTNPKKEGTRVGRWVSGWIRRRRRWPWWCRWCQGIARAVEWEKTLNSHPVATTPCNATRTLPHRILVVFFGGRGEGHESVFLRTRKQASERPRGFSQPTVSHISNTHAHSLTHSFTVSRHTHRQTSERDAGTTMESSHSNSHAPLYEGNPRRRTLPVSVWP